MGDERRAIYALYKGDYLLETGTIYEIAKKQGVTYNTAVEWTKERHRLINKGNAKVAIRIR